MCSETIIGFDSAWTDNSPGAICTITHADGKVVEFKPPQLVRFKEAAEVVEDARKTADFTLVALDQPTLVPNGNGMRPVECVAGSVVNKLKGGVQPANRQKTSMFGRAAPVWQFLDRIDARENPAAAREASSGLFLIEVFPALALPALVPAIWHRRHAAKYNPAGRFFSLHDWRLVSEGVADLAKKLSLSHITNNANELAMLDQPTKADQDKLDALICLLVAWIWRRQSRDASMVIGDGFTGYMVTPVSAETRQVLMASARKRQVPIEGQHDWHEDAKRTVDQLTAGETWGSKNEGQKPQLAPMTAGSTHQVSAENSCPECGHTFRGRGWGGIDAHWRKYHENIMPYRDAWPIIQSGGKPSSERDSATTSPRRPVRWRP